MGRGLASPLLFHTAFRSLPHPFFLFLYIYCMCTAFSLSLSLLTSNTKTYVHIYCSLHTCSLTIKERELLGLQCSRTPQPSWPPAPVVFSSYSPNKQLSQDLVTHIFPPPPCFLPHAQTKAEVGNGSPHNIIEQE